MLGKLTWTYCGLILLAAGLAGLACSQETQKPVKVGTAQVELHSDLVLSETQRPALTLLDEKNPNNSGQSQNQIQAIRRIPLAAPVKYSKERDYNSVKRYEFLHDLEKDPKSQKAPLRIITDR